MYGMEAVLCREGVGRVDKEACMSNSVFQRLGALAAVLALLASGACAYAPTRAYPGPALPAEQTAVVESGPYTDIVSADGVEVRGLSAALLPGNHTIAMIPVETGQPNQGWLFYSRVTGSVAFTAEAGHRYTAYVDFVGQSVPGHEDYSGWSWFGCIQDKATGVRLARTERLPLGAYPYSHSSGGPGRSMR